MPILKCIIIYMTCSFLMVDANILQVNSLNSESKLQHSNTNILLPENVNKNGSFENSSKSVSLTNRTSLELSTTLLNLLNGKLEQMHDRKTIEYQLNGKINTNLNLAEGTHGSKIPLISVTNEMNFLRRLRRSSRNSANQKSHYKNRMHSPIKNKSKLSKVNKITSDGYLISRSSKIHGKEDQRVSGKNQDEFTENKMKNFNAVPDLTSKNSKNKPETEKTNASRERISPRLHKKDLMLISKKGISRTRKSSPGHSLERLNKANKMKPTVRGKSEAQKSDGMIKGNEKTLPGNSFTKLKSERKVGPHRNYPLKTHPVDESTNFQKHNFLKNADDSTRNKRNDILHEVRDFIVNHFPRKLQKRHNEKIDKGAMNAINRRQDKDAQGFESGELEDGDEGSKAILSEIKDFVVKNFHSENQKRRSASDLNYSSKLHSVQTSDKENNGNGSEITKREDFPPFEGVANFTSSEYDDGTDTAENNPKRDVDTYFTFHKNANAYTEPRNSMDTANPPPETGKVNNDLEFTSSQYLLSSSELDDLGQEYNNMTEEFSDEEFESSTSVSNLAKGRRESHDNAALVTSETYSIDTRGVHGNEPTSETANFQGTDDESATATDDFSSSGGSTAISTLEYQDQELTHSTNLTDSNSLPRTSTIAEDSYTNLDGITNELSAPSPALSLQHRNAPTRSWSRSTTSSSPSTTFVSRLGSSQINMVRNSRGFQNVPSGAEYQYELAGTDDASEKQDISSDSENKDSKNVETDENQDDEDIEYDEDLQSGTTSLPKMDSVIATTEKQIKREKLSRVNNSEILQTEQQNEGQGLSDQTLHSLVKHEDQTPNQKDEEEEYDSDDDSEDANAMETTSSAMKTTTTVAPHETLNRKVKEKNLKNNPDTNKNREKSPKPMESSAAKTFGDSKNEQDIQSDDYDDTSESNYANRVEVTSSVKNIAKQTVLKDLSQLRKLSDSKNSQRDGERKNMSYLLSRTLQKPEDRHKKQKEQEKGPGYKNAASVNHSENFKEAERKTGIKSALQQGKLSIGNYQSRNEEEEEDNYEDDSEETDSEQGNEAEMTDIAADKVTLIPQMTLHSDKERNGLDSLSSGKAQLDSSSHSVRKSQRKSQKEKYEEMSDDYEVTPDSNDSAEITSIMVIPAPQRDSKKLDKRNNTRNTQAENFDKKDNLFTSAIISTEEPGESQEEEVEYYDEDTSKPSASQKIKKAQGNLSEYQVSDDDYENGSSDSTSYEAATTFKPRKESKNSHGEQSKMFQRKRKISQFTDRKITSINPLTVKENGAPVIEVNSDARFSGNRKQDGSHIPEAMSVNVQNHGSERGKNSNHKPAPVTHVAILPKAKVDPKMLTTSPKKSRHPEAKPTVLEDYQKGDSNEDYYDAVANGNRDISDKSSRLSSEKGKMVKYYAKEGMADPEDYDDDSKEDLPDYEDSRNQLHVEHNLNKETADGAEKSPKSKFAPDEFRTNHNSETRKNKEQVKSHLNSVPHPKHTMNRHDSMTHVKTRKAREAPGSDVSTILPKQEDVPISPNKQWFFGIVGLIVVSTVTLGIYIAMPKSRNFERIPAQDAEEVSAIEDGNISDFFVKDDNASEKWRTDVGNISCFIEEILQKCENSECVNRKEEYSAVEHFSKIHAAVKGTIE